MTKSLARGHQWCIFSVVLLALVDANLTFLVIDVGAYVPNRDGGIFANSNLGKATTNGGVNWPADHDAPISNAERLGPMPYVAVGDETFPLQGHLMRTNAGRGCPHDVEVFNYCLSRTRRIVENAFGILVERFLDFHTKFAVNPDLNVDVIQCAGLVHNILQTDSSSYRNHSVLITPMQNAPGDFRGIGNRAARHAEPVRYKFKDYFNILHNWLRSMAWQDDVVDGVT